MTKTDLDYLVRLARRERPPTEALVAIARSLRVPFAALPVAAAVVPSSALAGVLAKLGVSRLWLLGWGAGSAAVVTGAVAAVTLTAPEPRLVEAPPAVNRAVVSERRHAKAPQPEAAVESEVSMPIASAEQPKLRDTPPLWAEPQLIERARKALSTDPQRALALVQEHQRRFPSGTLGVEREVIALEALARSGRSSEARKRALAFETKYPTSIYLPQVRALRARLGSP